MVVDRNLEQSTDQTGLGPLGIVAGAGSLPIEIADHAAMSGRAVHIVALRGFADETASRHPSTIVDVGQIGGLMAALRTAGCRDIVIAGAARRPNLFRTRIDRGVFRVLPTLLAMTRGGDDSVLRRLVVFFESQGFRVRGIDEVAPLLLAEAAVLGNIQPTGEAWSAIDRASAVIRALGPFDVGQAAIARADQLLAVEGGDGTDAMLRRVALARARLEGEAGTGARPPVVLVKLPKPGQELRVDLPAIGPRTIDRAHEAGLDGIAVAAGGSLVLERERTIARASELGLFLVGVSSPAGVKLDRRDATPSLRGDDWTVRGRVRAAGGERRDMALATRLIAELERLAAGRVVVVAGERVVRIDAGLGADGIFDDLRLGSHWGIRVLRRRFGVVVAAELGDLANDPAAAGALAERAAGSGLAGVAILRAPPSDQLAGRTLSALVDALDRRHLFLATLTGEGGSK